MEYLKPSFTLPAAPIRITQEKWEIAMGLRCADCKRLKTTPKKLREALKCPTCSTSR